MERLYIDMDGVLCDYISQYNHDLNVNTHQPYPQSQYGFFIKLKPLPNAIEAVNELKLYYDVWILTRPSLLNLNSYSEKAFWIREYLGQEFVNKLIMCPDKSLVKGHYLIDDTNYANQDKFEGEWIHFGSEAFPDWGTILVYLNLYKKICMKCCY